MGCATLKKGAVTTEMGAVVAVAALSLDAAGSLTTTLV